MTATFTAEELSKFDGRGDAPIYISVKGKVYDCSSAGSFYGPGQSYAVFAGRDATRCLAKMMISDEEANAGWSNLSEEHLQTLEEWVQKFESKYKVVGTFTFDPDFESRGLGFAP